MAAHQSIRKVFGVTALGWALAAAPMSAGCTGKIGAPGTRGGTSGGAGTTGTALPPGPGTAPPPGPMGGPGNSFIDHDSPALERLTNVEYSHAVSDVLGEAPARRRVTRSRPIPRSTASTTTSRCSRFRATHADRYSTAAEAIATATLADPARRSLVAGCDLATGGACLQTMIQQLGRRLFRRPLTTDEVSGYTSLAAAGPSPRIRCRAPRR